jgi:filamentous hemagglutinin
MVTYGTGSDMQRGIQAATAALQGLAGGNIGGALAGASAPELAHLLKSTEDNPAINTIAHAILGGAVAVLQGIAQQRVRQVPRPVSWLRML